MTSEHPSPHPTLPPTSEQILLERRESEERKRKKNEAPVHTSSSRYGGLVRHKVAGRGVREVGVIVFESEVNRICIQWEPLNHLAAESG